METSIPGHFTRSTSQEFELSHPLAYLVMPSLIRAGPCLQMTMIIIKVINVPCILKERKVKTHGRKHFHISYTCGIVHPTLEKQTDAERGEAAGWR
jgi:hypothetical protein